MLTVNSSFLAINSLVPSRGSTKKILVFSFSFLFSSEIIGIFGNSFFNLLQIILFDSLSASVIGERSFFKFILKSKLYISITLFDASQHMFSYNRYFIFIIIFIYH